MVNADRNILSKVLCPLEGLKQVHFFEALKVSQVRGEFIWKAESRHFEYLVTEHSTQSRLTENLEHFQIEEGLNVGGFEHHGRVRAFARASDTDDAATYM